MEEDKPPHTRGNYRYNIHLRNFAHENRSSLTKSATCLWKFVLSKRQMMGYQFRRERPVDWYIADFMCMPLALIIEVDGITHHTEECKEKDRKRDLHLQEHGFTTLRFCSLQVLNNIGEVRRQISEWIEENATVPPPPPRLRKRREK